MCRSCTNKCNNEEANSDTELQCPICDGTGCESCDDGYIKIKGCPNQYISDMIQAVHVIDYFHQGILPTSGGLLDQSAWMVEAARVLKNEDAIARAERNG